VPIRMTSVAVRGSTRHSVEIPEELESRRRETRRQVETTADQRCPKGVSEMQKRLGIPDTNLHCEAFRRGHVWVCLNFARLRFCRQLTFHQHHDRSYANSCNCSLSLRASQRLHGEGSERVRAGIPDGRHASPATERSATKRGNSLRTFECLEMFWASECFDEMNSEFGQLTPQTLYDQTIMVR